jgi:glycosyltransferase involved in cell wall biosynthesis
VAQEREKTRIVLASILKPVDDTRMTGKMGTSLAGAGYSVSIIGFAPAGVLPSGLSYYSLGEFPRLSLRRYLARWRAFQLAFTCRPHLFIFSTHELIFPALLLKVLLGTRVVYDVRENYYRNIRHSEGLFAAWRWPLALFVRGIEKVTAPMMDYFFLAEKGYESEFRFHRGGWTVIENKAFLPPASSGFSPRGWNLLFSGTLSESTGVFRAIQLAATLHARQPAVTLTIVGYAATSNVQKRIRGEAEAKPYIRLIGIETHVPHGDIVAQIQQARAGIIAYLPMPHTLNSVPTKLFEYLTASLPILCDSGWPWISRFEASRPFVTVRFDHPDAEAILDALTQRSFYPAPAREASWQTEAPRLLAAVKNIV